MHFQCCVCKGNRVPGCSDLDKEATAVEHVKILLLLEIVQRGIGHVLYFGVYGHGVLLLAHQEWSQVAVWTIISYIMCGPVVRWEEIFHVSFETTLKSGSLRWRSLSQVTLFRSRSFAPKSGHDPWGMTSLFGFSTWTRKPLGHIGPMACSWSDDFMFSNLVEFLLFLQDLWLYNVWFVSILDLWGIEIFFHLFLSFVINLLIRSVNWWVIIPHHDKAKNSGQICPYIKIHHKWHD